MPVIAAVHGVAYGLAIDIVVACDVRIAAEGTRFGVKVSLNLCERVWGLDVWKREGCGISVRMVRPGGVRIMGLGRGTTMEEERGGMDGMALPLARIRGTHARAECSYSRSFIPTFPDNINHVRSSF